MGVNIYGAKPNESLPSDEWLKSIGVLKNRTDEIDNLVPKQKAKKITLLREQGFAEHQNGNYDDAVEIFKTANAREEEKFHHQQTRTQGTNMQGKVSRRIQEFNCTRKKGKSSSFYWSTFVWTFKNRERYDVKGSRRL